MGQLGRERAIAHFSEDSRTEHFLKIYQQLLTHQKMESPDSLMLN
jgi:hypothetical protein